MKKLTNIIKYLLIIVGILILFCGILNSFDERHYYKGKAVDIVSDSELISMIGVVLIAVGVDMVVRPYISYKNKQKNKQKNK